MGLSRSTFYGPPHVAAAPGEVLVRIKAICDEFECYGYRRVDAALRHQGLVVNSKKVRRLMREHDLQPKQRRRYVVTPDSEHDSPDVIHHTSRHSAPAGGQLREDRSHTIPNQGILFNIYSIRRSLTCRRLFRSDGGQWSEQRAHVFANGSGERRHSAQRGVEPASLDLGDVCLRDAGLDFDVTLGEASFDPGKPKILPEKNLQSFSVATYCAGRSCTSVFRRTACRLLWHL